MKVKQKNKLFYVPDRELKEWESFFNDRKKWGIREDLNKEKNISRGTLNRILIAGRAKKNTIIKIRDFIKNYEPATI